MVTTTVELAELPGRFSINSGVLKSSLLKPKTGGTWPKLEYIRPKVTIDKKVVERYVKVCGWQPQQGVPFLFPHIEAFPLALMMFKSADFPFRAMGSVHLANSVKLYDRLHINDELRIEVHTGNLYTHDKGQVFTLHAKANRDNALVWESTWSILRPGFPDPVGSRFDTGLKENPRLFCQADIPTRLHTTRQYALLSGDLNPIHLTYLSARAMGFKRALTHGMWTKSRALSLLMPQQPVDICEVSVEFKSPLYLPSKATLWKQPVNNGASFEVRNPKGDRYHLRGTLQFKGSTPQ